jgi:hypothetical protein
MTRGRQFRGSALKITKPRRQFASLSLFQACV